MQPPPGLTVVDSGQLDWELQHTLCYVPGRVLPYELVEPPEPDERTLDTISLHSWFPRSVDDGLNWEHDGGDSASASMQGAGMAFKLWTSWEPGNVWISVHALKRVPGAVPVAFCAGKAPDCLALEDVNLQWGLKTNRGTWACHGTSVALPVRSGIREASRFSRFSAPNDARAAYARVCTDPRWIDAAISQWSLSWGKLKLIRFSPSGPPHVCDVAVPSQVGSTAAIEATVFDAALGLVYLQDDALEAQQREVYCLSYA
jgi:hypothetical protein